MKRWIFSGCQNWLFFALALMTPSLVLGADIVLQKAPPLTIREAPSFPQNLARYHLGAEIKAAPRSVPISKLQLSDNNQDANNAEAALLCDDPTTGYELPAGATTILISLSTIENVESLSFFNDGGQGEFSIAVSNADVAATSPEWRTVGTGQMGKGALATKIGPAEAKYVRLRFEATTAGRIASLGIYATPALSDFTMPRPSKVSFEESSASFALINFNYSELHARARALYASSGNLEQINYMLDDQAATAYEFASNDAAPTTVIDLGRDRTISRLTVLYSKQAGNFDFYILRNLPGESQNDSGSRSDVRQVVNVPESAGPPSRLTISEKTLAALRPVGSVASKGEGRAAVNFPEMVGRYVMLKWQPIGHETEPFSIAQVAAFGRSTAAENFRDGKDGKDGKALGGKEAIGEGPAPEEGPPPGLPPVPPFTFIPEVPPTSP